MISGRLFLKGVENFPTTVENLHINLRNYFSTVKRVVKWMFGVKIGVPAKINSI